MLILSLTPLKSKFLHPLNLIFIVILYTISISLISNILMNSTWYSYIIFLTIISGMMILFMYFISIKSSNNLQLKKYFIQNFIYKMLFIMMLYLYLWMFYDQLTFFIQMNSSEILNTFQISSFININSMNSLFMFMSFSFKMTLILICYLMLIMFISTKLSLLTKGSLRSFSK
uniref:NADH dehydrogenase subunit 6 n=1 Tax=Sirex nitobei TaxID=1602346 RepID=UPI0023D7F211|nr:NADH dehydrogenase subunit 6 [Sirex nitobei]WDR47218.1 NADH dehydrogenase subunit 6 [Sirex nitobei]